MIGLSVKFLFFSIGESDFFSSFFYTIHHHLEKGKWGDTYPSLLNELYVGEVKNNRLSELEKELLEVKRKLKLILPTEVIWDIDDLNKKPPWGDDISETITDLSNYYLTSSGKDLFDVLFSTIDHAKKFDSDIKVRNTFQRPDI